MEKKTRKKSTPKSVQMTMGELRKLGILCGSVEKFVKTVGSFGFRKDLFGFIDIIALDPARGIIGVQACCGGFQEHYRKIVEEKNENAHTWLTCHGLIELWGWRKLKVKRGGKAMRWTPRVQEITLQDLGDLQDLGEPECQVMTNEELLKILG